MKTRFLRYEESKDTENFVNDDLRAILDSMITESETEDLLIKLINSYIHFEEKHGIKVLRDAVALRKDCLQDIFAQSDVIEIEAPYDPVLHRKYMTSIMASSALRGSTKGKEMTIQFLNQVSRESIETGVLQENIRFDEESKTFRKEQKLTRVLSFIGEKGNNYEIKNKITGNFVPQNPMGTKIFASISPVAILMAGIEGGSCVSPYGENAYGTATALGYQNLFVAHDAAFNWRAWVMVDTAEKVYWVGKGYPKESFENQIALMEFMRERGYEFVAAKGNGDFLYSAETYFKAPGYMDFSAIVYPADMKGRRILRSAGFTLGIPFIFSDVMEGRNDQATHIWTQTINTDYDMDQSETIVTLYECQGCGDLRLHEFDDGAYCDNCYGYNNCNSCGEAYWEDDMIWCEDHGYMCNSCFNDEVEKELGTERLEKTIVYAYDLIERFITAETGDEVWLEEHYRERMSDNERKNMLTGFVQNDFIQGWADLFTIVGPRLGGSDLHGSYANRPALSSEHFDLLRANRNHLEREINDFYRHRWLEGRVEL